MDGGEAGQLDKVALCLAAGGINQVSAVLTFFFGRIAGTSNTDEFDVKQGIELVWRELGGLPKAKELRREVMARLPERRMVAVASPEPWAKAVVAALDGIEALIEEPRSALERLSLVWARSLEVAVNFDLSGVPRSEGELSWLGRESRAQAALADSLPLTTETLSDEMIFDIRTRSGSAAMGYRAALRSFRR